MACLASVLAAQTCDPEPCGSLNQIVHSNGDHDCGCVTEAHHEDVNKQACGDDGTGAEVRESSIVDGARRLQTISAGPMQR
jgi:hypothetical protein